MRIHRRGAAALLLAGGVAVSTAGVATAATPSFRTATVMSRNLYFGTDLTPILQAQTQLQLVVAVGAAYQQVVASNITERAMADAQEIATTHPDLVGLQEAALWGLAPFADPASITPTYDFVQLIVQDLASLGYSYHAASTSVNFEAEAPALLPTGFAQVFFRDRDVILARDEAKISVSNPQHGSYAVSVVIPGTPIGDVTIPRGWASVDVDMRGTSFRFVDTHLEAYSNVVRDYQAMQLTGMLAGYTGDLVVTGDFNSSAPPAGADSSVTYNWMLGAGYADGWLAKPRTVNGFTCCQGGTLSNDVSQLDERIDFVFLRNGPTALGMQLVGDQQADRTPSGLWPSDHAGVVADVRIP
jgi:hypothetical protein